VGRQDVPETMMPTPCVTITIFCGRRQLNVGKWSWIPDAGTQISINRQQYRIVSVRQDILNRTIMTVEPLTKKPEEPNGHHH
jgi:hypothetical protein